MVVIYSRRPHVSLTVLKKVNDRLTSDRNLTYLVFGEPSMIFIIVYIIQGFHDVLSKHGFFIYPDIQSPLHILYHYIIKVVRSIHYNIESTHLTGFLISSVVFCN